MNHGSIHSFVHGLVYGTWFMVSLIMFFLNMLDYPLFFPSRSTLTLNTIATLSGTWGFYLNHVIPLRPFKTVLANVLLEHGADGALPCVLPFIVHLDLGHPPDTQRYLGLLSEPCTQNLLKLGLVGWEPHKILVTAKSQILLILFPFLNLPFWAFLPITGLSGTDR